MTIDLFEYGASRDHGASRNTDPPTSQAAAESINPRYLEGIVLAAITRAGSRGMTSEEVAASVSMELGSITPRLSPLEQQGLIRRTDARRAGKSGRGRIVWAHS